MATPSAGRCGHWARCFASTIGSSTQRMPPRRKAPQLPPTQRTCAPQCHPRRLQCPPTQRA
eukprot:14211491-Alexandrium_andersonii.AAC.1